MSPVRIPQQTGFPQSLDGLRQSLAARFGLSTLLETPPAAMFRRVREISQETEEKLDQLQKEMVKKGLKERQLDLANSALFAAEIAPSGLLALHRHDGIGPLPVAVLHPQNDDQYRIAHDLLRQFDFAAEFDIASEGNPNQHDSRPIIAISKTYLDKVEILEAETGMVHFEHHAPWQVLVEAAQNAGLGLPQKAFADRFAKPALAAEAGLFEEMSRDRHGVRVRLPQQGQQILRGTWLFAHEEKALELFQRIARRHRPLFLEFIPHTDLMVSAGTGLLPKPLPWQARQWRGALRIACMGTQITSQLALAGIAWEMEWAGGIKIAENYFPTGHDRQKALLWSGASEVAIAKNLRWQRINKAKGDAIARLQKRARETVGTIPLLANGDAITALRLISTKGANPIGELAVLYPRDFLRPDAQWIDLYQRLTNPMAASPAETVDPSTDEVENSEEWQEIRRALLAGQPGHAA